MSIDLIEADLALADAFWWLRGFGAANPAEDSAGQAGDGIGRARATIQKLTSGDAIVVRAWGEHHDKQGFRIVISEAEFDRIFDGLRSSDPNDVKDGLACATALRDRAMKEIKQILQPEMPF